MDNPEKLTATQDQEKKNQQNKICIGHHITHVNIHGRQNSTIARSMNADYKLGQYNLLVKDHYS